MNEESLRELLASVVDGTQSVDEAVTRLRAMPFEDIGFAKIDHHRSIRCGFPEVIYAEHKSAEQVAAIFDRCVRAGTNLLVTRASPEVFAAVAAVHSKSEYNEAARTITLRQQERIQSTGTIAIVAAGTSDFSVAEEARITAETMDQQTATFYDVGVAGIHRLLAQSNAR